MAPFFAIVSPIYMIIGASTSIKSVYGGSSLWYYVEGCFQQLVGQTLTNAQQVEWVAIRWAIMLPLSVLGIIPFVLISPLFFPDLAWKALFGRIN